MYSIVYKRSIFRLFRFSLRPKQTKRLLLSQKYSMANEVYRTVSSLEQLIAESSRGWTI